MLSKKSTALNRGEQVYGANTLVGYLLVGLTVLAYFLYLGLNNIWTPNESFYAEAVREMLATGDYLNINYNYEPRFNKPPLLYWLMALSANLFGLSEFSIRLPVALCGLGTVYLVYEIGRLLKDSQLGIVAAAVMVFSFQFVINARYGSPAVPLTFFFTWTMYLFLKGYLQNRFGLILLAYIALGLTVLMKGYPYLIVISMIIGTYLLLDSQFRLKSFWSKIKFLKPWFGLPIALVIGMSWIAYMYWSYGDAFYEVFMDETFRRAFTRKSSLKPFFYLEANLWGFLPYSITFYFGLIYLMTTRFKDLLTKPALKFGFSWFLVMFIIFTIAKGKIPTYFIQGHPGMSIFTAYFILNIKPETLKARRWYNLQFWIPGILFSLISVLIVYVFKANYLLFLVALLPLAAIMIKEIEWFKITYFPFYSFLMTYLLFGWIVLPKVEEGYRNHHLIGQAIQEKVEDPKLPLMIQDYLVHNLPYYAQRKVLDYCSPEDIKQQFLRGKALAMVPKENADSYGSAQEVWRGIIYYGSETRTLEYILNTLKYQRRRGKFI